VRQQKRWRFPVIACILLEIDVLKALYGGEVQQELEVQPQTPPHNPELWITA